MTFHCRVPIWIAALTLLIGVVPVSAQTPAPQPGIQELIHRAVQQTLNGQPPTAPESPATAESDLPQDARPIVALSLDDVVKLALDRNLTIAVQRLNPPQFDP